MWRILYICIWIWQFPQNLMGIVLMWKKKRHILPAGLICTQWKYPTLCLGEYLFVSTPDLLRFSWGRGILSRILGPMYIPFISIPSFLCLIIYRNPGHYLDLYATRLTLKIIKKR